MMTYMTHPFLTVDKAKFSSYGPKGYFSGQPSLAYSGSVSFDAIVNQPQKTRMSHSADYFLFQVIVNFFDDKYAYLYNNYFQVSLKLMPEVNLEVDSPQISNQIHLTIKLVSDIDGVNQTVPFNIREAASCSDDSSVGVNLSNVSISQKLQSLNYLQVLSKLTLFYKVGSDSL